MLKKYYNDKIICLWVDRCNINLDVETNIHDDIEYKWNFWNWEMSNKKNPKSIWFSSGSYLWSVMIKGDNMNEKIEFTIEVTWKELTPEENILVEEFELIFLDLDGLKLVNDHKGHNVGDLMIVRFSQALSQAIIEKEMIFRVGGDEFVVTTEIGRSEEFISQVKAQLQGERISFSYGVEQATRCNFKQALIRSDQAMYEMKKEQKESNDEYYLIKKSNANKKYTLVN